jgi:hypothetical protein
MTWMFILFYTCATMIFLAGCQKPSPSNHLNVS